MGWWQSRFFTPHSDSLQQSSDPERGHEFDRDHNIHTASMWILTLCFCRSSRMNRLDCRLEIKTLSHSPNNGKKPACFPNASTVFVEFRMKMPAERVRSTNFALEKLFRSAFVGTGPLFQINQQTSGGFPLNLSSLREIIKINFSINAVDSNDRKFNKFDPCDSLMHSKCCDDLIFIHIDQEILTLSINMHFHYNH
jgi:hypothetical protein